MAKVAQKLLCSTPTKKKKKEAQLAHAGVNCNVRVWFNAAVAVPPPKNIEGVVLGLMRCGRGNTEAFVE